MSEMPELIIANTSCLILLSKINFLNLLEKLYGQVFITPEISGEYGSTLPSYIKVKEVPDKKYIQLLSWQIDKGEASTIALALSTSNSLVIWMIKKPEKWLNNLT